MYIYIYIYIHVWVYIQRPDSLFPHWSLSGIMASISEGPGPWRSEGREPTRHGPWKRIEWSSVVLKSHHHHHHHHHLCPLCSSPSSSTQWPSRWLALSDCLPSTAAILKWFPAWRDKVWCLKDFFTNLSVCGMYRNQIFSILVHMFFKDCLPLALLGSFCACLQDFDRAEIAPLFHRVILHGFTWWKGRRGDRQNASGK